MIGTKFQEHDPLKLILLIFYISIIESLVFQNVVIKRMALRFVICWNKRTKSEAIK